MSIIAYSFNRIRQALNVVPKEYDLEIKEEVTNKNINRIFTLTVLLIIMNLVMIILDVTVYLPKWSINREYINLFYSHAFLLIERSLYLAAVYLIQAKGARYLYRLQNFFVIYSCMIGLIWCSYLSINAQGIHGQISAFIVGNFSIASAILLMPLQSFIAFTVNSLIFTVGLYYTDTNSDSFTGNLVNIIFVVVFSLVMSNLNILMYGKNYKNNKTIQDQARQLELSRNELEDTVISRTEELVKTNEQLIKEIGIRHEIEVQSIRTKFMYDENTILLSKIKEYEELRNVFFANLSHELRTPLNVIFSAQQMMNLIISKQSCEDCKHQISKYNKIVKQNCYRLIRLIGNLIDITKIDAKYFEINKKNCDIVNVVANITQSVSDYIKDKNIELVFDTEIEERIISFDPDKVERIMLNLLSNAVKFTAEKGQINVKIKSIDGYVAISVIDNGIGISRELQNTVFERFIQADKTIARNREGSGIGLSLVKSLVDLHQGKISLISEQGKGSEFIVMLPDVFVPSEDSIACTYDANNQDIERINIEFSDIYS
jgi:signal transduction histidine kinase